MKKYWVPIALVLFSTLLNTGAQVSFKLASSAFDFSFAGVVMNLPFWIGFGLYGVSAVLLILAFSGGELSVLNPLQAASFIWTILAAWLILGEAISIATGIGVLVIIAGIILMTVEHTGGALSVPN